jgi:hypothetical protein
MQSDVTKDVNIIFFLLRHAIIVVAISPLGLPLSPGARNSLKSHFV